MRATRVKRKPIVDLDMSLGAYVVDESILSKSEAATKLYGESVIMNRALPDYRDGLKPVHRRILWAMYRLNLHHKGPFKKSARTVGDVLGKYHPHGDISIYDAMAGMVSQVPVPLISGQGNFGDHVDGPAAMRYTEARLSKYSDCFLLDPEYLKVTPMLPNFSDDDQEPVYLPSRLPTLLLNGTEGIAVGLATNIPSFHMEGVKKCAVQAIRKGSVTPKYVANNLEFNFRYGGERYADDTGLLSICTSGRGSITFVPFFEVDEERQTITITSVAPRLTLVRETPKGDKAKAAKDTPTRSRSAQEAILEINNVIEVLDATGSSKDDANLKEIKLIVYCAKNTTRSQFASICQEVEKAVQTTVHYNVAVTERMDDGSVTFWQVPLTNIVNSWAKWRVEFERKVLASKISDLQSAIFRDKLIIKALDNIQVIIKSLEVEKPVEFLMEKLRISEKAAEYILSLRIRQLTKMERGKILARLKELQQEKSLLEADLDAPQERIVNDIRNITF